MPVVPLVETAPFVDSDLETPPAPDPDPLEEAVFDEVVFDSLPECLQGNWAVDNDAFADFFARTDDRVTTIEVSGVATVLIEGSQLRMFFDEWDIRYETGDPAFLIARARNENIDFLIRDGDEFEVVERDNQIVFGIFSLMSGDGEGVGITTTDPGYLPFDGAALACTAATLTVDVAGEPFVLNRV
jgi:hypothetical protein